MNGDTKRLVGRCPEESARGGFFKMKRPAPPGESVVDLIAMGRTVTKSDRRAFLKRVAKRRAKKGYR